MILRKDFNITLSWRESESKSSSKILINWEREKLWRNNSRAFFLCLTLTWLSMNLMDYSVSTRLQIKSKCSITLNSAQTSTLPSPLMAFKRYQLPVLLQSLSTTQLLLEESTSTWLKMRSQLLLIFLRNTKKLWKSRDFIWNQCSKTSISLEISTLQNINSWEL